MEKPLKEKTWKHFSFTRKIPKVRGMPKVRDARKTPSKTPSGGRRDRSLWLKPTSQSPDFTKDVTSREQVISSCRGKDGGAGGGSWEGKGAQRRGRNKFTSKCGRGQWDMNPGELPMEEYASETILLASPLGEELYA